MPRHRRPPRARTPTGPHPQSPCHDHPGRSAASRPGRSGVPHPSQLVVRNARCLNNLGFPAQDPSELRGGPERRQRAFGVRARVPGGPGSRRSRRRPHASTSGGCATSSDRTILRSPRASVRAPVERRRRRHRPARAVRQRLPLAARCPPRRTDRRPPVRDRTGHLADGRRQRGGPGRAARR